MKIHFGFPNPDNINKLAPTLQALNLNLLKAEPGKVALKGLHRIPQDGYTAYSGNLPAFIYATEIQKSVPLTREGYPILTKVEDIIPFPIPRIYIVFKGTKDVSPRLKAFTECKSISTKDKNQKAYTLEYKPGLLAILMQTDYERNIFPIAGTVLADDLPVLFNILRIASGFLRTHKYPAFPTNEEFEYEFQTGFDSLKRTLTTDDEYAVGDDNQPIKKMIKIEVDGELTWVKPELEMTEAVVHLKRAKPVSDNIPAWGDSTSIPNTDGIVFPYVEELANWDKDTVCTTIGLYFVRCLGHTTEGALRSYSELCLHWKRSLFRTPLGNALTHLFRVIDLGIPCQARIFPVINDGTYTGCYLSGSGYSIALKSELFRPTTYENNTADFDCFDSTEALLMKIGATVTNMAEKKNVTKLKEIASSSMRGLNNYLKGWVIATDKWERIRLLASRIKYPQEFLRINMTNISFVLSLLVSGTEPPVTFPMHAQGLGRTSHIEIILSAFGSTAPSPTIPGANRIQITPKAPANFSKILAFRTTTLQTAIADWKEFGDKGFLYNGPDRLSSRYQYVQIRGNEDREQFFTVLSGYHVWFKEEQTRGLNNEVVTNDDDDFEGGVLVGAELGLDISGF